MGGQLAAVLEPPGPSPSSKPDGVEVHVIVAPAKNDQWRGIHPGDSS